MSRIRILSEHLANQIAAGEVVERPASVVKELVENSLDAGAGRIEVHVEGSGTRLIRVADNGEGMDGDDVLLCIERHATSKLRESAHLSGISTLGFRGEALPSIGSVSRLVILSRVAGSELGTRAEVRYGSLRDVHAEGCARGTVIEVRGLFGNLPARKKFLKSARTEQHHVEEVIREQALAHPGVEFILRVEQRVVLEYPATSELEQRVRAVYRYRGRMVPLQHPGTASTMGISGFLLLPEAGGARSARLRFLVNGRPVQDRMLRHGVIEGLQGYLMKGYQPAGALLLDMAADQVDVNVHPAKREIRFRQAREVHLLVVRAVSGAMQVYQEETRSGLFQRADPPRYETPGAPAHWQAQAAEPAPQRPPEAMGGMDAGGHGNAAVSVAATAVPPGRGSAREVTAGRPVPPPEREVAVQGEYGGLRVIGQLFNLYLLCERQGELVVIDQHAAHERILFGRLRQGYLDRSVSRQQLLFPVALELGPEQADLVEAHQEELVRIGFGLAYFGDTTWVIKDVPAAVSTADPAELLMETLDSFAGGLDRGGDHVPARIDHLLSGMACKAAIKAGNRLRPEEMLRLLEEMEQSRVFSHCPHGRPVLKVFGSADIEKWFHRRE